MLTSSPLAAGDVSVLVVVSVVVERVAFLLDDQVVLEANQLVHGPVQVPDVPGEAGQRHGERGSHVHVVNPQGLKSTKL